MEKEVSVTGLEVMESLPSQAESLLGEVVKNSIKIGCSSLVIKLYDEVSSQHIATMEYLEAHMCLIRALHQPNQCVSKKDQNSWGIKCPKR